LYDPRDTEEASKIPNSKDTECDKTRVFKDEGVYPEFHGSYHMYHFLDEKLFAIGVIDITPNIVSSVYFMYDPEFDFLAPGIFGAIREIEYTNKIRKDFDEQMKYYYMGFYIPDCQKSVYKGEYSPSELLCPITYTWVPLEKIKEKIKAEQY